MRLENVVIANALQLEAAQRRAVPLHFNFVARAEFKVAQPIRCRLKSIFTAYTLRYVVTLNFDPVTLTFDLMTLNMYHVLRYALRYFTPVSYTHLTLPTKRIV